MFHNSIAWKKKTMTSCFDVTMGSYDGAKVCKLISIFILSKLGNIIGKKNIGLYRNDGLVVLNNMNAWRTDQMRKIIIKMLNLDFNLK